MSAPRLRVTVSRNDLCLILDGLESVIEEFKYDGGLNLAEEYVELRERLRDRLNRHDGAGRYRPPVRETPQPPDCLPECSPAEEVHRVDCPRLAWELREAVRETPQP